MFYQFFHKNTCQKGQSTIEFILSFTGAIGFIFLFYRMAFNYANGFMAHHAVYMASRSYLVGDEDIITKNSSLQNTPGDVFNYYNGPLFTPRSPEGLQAQYSTGAGSFAVFTGLWINFSQFFSTSFMGGKTEIKFRSESFLGREPTQKESWSQTCDAIGKITGGGCDVHATLDDNGG